MKPNHTGINHILDIMARAPGCRIEQGANLLPYLTFKVRNLLPAAGGDRPL